MLSLMFYVIYMLCLSVYFNQGEEIAIGIRGFTYGYDFYAPKDSVVFHEYAVKSNRRKSVHMFWYVNFRLVYYYCSN